MNLQVVSGVDTLIIREDKMFRCFSLKKDLFLFLFLFVLNLYGYDADASVDSDSTDNFDGFTFFDIREMLSGSIESAEIILNNKESWKETIESFSEEEQIFAEVKLCEFLQNEENNNSVRVLSAGLLVNIFDNERAVSCIEKVFESSPNCAEEEFKRLPNNDNFFGNKRFLQNKIDDCEFMRLIAWQMGILINRQKVDDEKYLLLFDSGDFDTKMKILLMFAEMRSERGGQKIYLDFFKSVMSDTLENIHVRNLAASATISITELLNLWFEDSHASDFSADYMASIFPQFLDAIIKRIDSADATFSKEFNKKSTSYITKVFDLHRHDAKLFNEQNEFNLSRLTVRIIKNGNKEIACSAIDNLSSYYELHDYESRCAVKHTAPFKKEKQPEVSSEVSVVIDEDKSAENKKDQKHSQKKYRLVFPDSAKKVESISPGFYFSIGVDGLLLNRNDSGLAISQGSFKWSIPSKVTLIASSNWVILKLFSDFKNTIDFNIILPVSTNKEDSLYGHRFSLGSRLISFVFEGASHKSYPGYLIDWGWTPDITLNYGYQGKQGGVAFSLGAHLRYYKPLSWRYYWNDQFYILNMRYNEQDYRLLYEDYRSNYVYTEMAQMYDDKECMVHHNSVCVHKGQTDWWEYGFRFDSLFYLNFTDWAQFSLTPFYQWTSVAPGSQHRFGSGAEVEFKFAEAGILSFFTSLYGMVAYHKDDGRYKPFSGNVSLNFSVRL